MIRYALTCDEGHASESWFRDSAAFDALAGAGQLACPVCGSVRVSKAMMAPSIVRGRGRPGAAVVEQASGPESSPGPQPIEVSDDRQREMRDKLRELRKKMTETAEDVGRAFPEEARRIHEGDAPARSIYGEATGQEVRSLLEDGVPLLPLPMLPDDHH